MSNVIDLGAYRAKKEREKQIMADGGPCSCGTIMEVCDFYSDLHQGVERGFICPTCFNFRVNYEVN